METHLNNFFLSRNLSDIDHKFECECERLEGGRYSPLTDQFVYPERRVGFSVVCTRNKLIFPFV